MTNDLVFGAAYDWRPTRVWHDVGRIKRTQEIVESVREGVELWIHSVVCASCAKITGPGCLLVENISYFLCQIVLGEGLLE